MTPLEEAEAALQNRGVQTINLSWSDEQGFQASLIRRGQVGFEVYFGWDLEELISRAVARGTQTYVLNKN
jgi:hypothetical protein